MIGLASDEYSNFAPAFSVSVEGRRLGADLTELVSSLEYESTDGVMDEARITVANPDYKLCGSTLWQPGNQVDIWMGFGNSLDYIGRVVIVRPKPRFVSSGMPTIEIVGYTKDFFMARNRPDYGKDDIRNLSTDEISAAVESVASRPAYAFDFIDVDPTPEGKYCALQKADVTDYNYVKGLANTLGWYFWVDYTQENKWALHFKNPNGLRVQERKYTFEHSNGDKSTLIDFDPELTLDGAVTKLQVQCRNPETNEFYVEEFQDSDEPPDTRYENDPNKQLDTTHTTSGAVVKFIFGDSAVEVVSDKRFSSAAEMRVWADQWWRRRREHFVLGRGSTVGVTDLRARQVHTLKLPDASLSGDYYFARVRHQFSSGSGYTVDFTARKVVT